MKKKSLSSFNAVWLYVCTVCPKSLFQFLYYKKDAYCEYNQRLISFAFYFNCCAIQRRIPAAECGEGQTNPGQHLSGAGSAVSLPRRTFHSQVQQDIRYVLMIRDPGQHLSAPVPDIPGFPRRAFHIKVPDIRLIDWWTGSGTISL